MTDSSKRHSNTYNEASNGSRGKRRAVVVLKKMLRCLHLASPRFWALAMAKRSLYYSQEEDLVRMVVSQRSPSRNIRNAAIATVVPIPALLFHYSFLNYCPNGTRTGQNMFLQSWGDVCAWGREHPIGLLNVVFLVNVDVLFWLISLVQRSTWVCPFQVHLSSMHCFRRCKVSDSKSLSSQDWCTLIYDMINYHTPLVRANTAGWILSPGMERKCDWIHPFVRCFTCICPQLMKWWSDNDSDNLLRLVTCCIGPNFTVASSSMPLVTLSFLLYFSVHLDIILSDHAQGLKPIKWTYRRSHHTEQARPLLRGPKRYSWWHVPDY